MRRPSARWSAPLCAATLLIACGPGAEAPDAPTAADGDAGSPTGPVVAEVNGVAVTASELEDWIKEELYRRETQGKSAAELWQVRRDLLQQLIIVRVIEGEAARRDLTPEEMLAAEAEALGEVSDEEIQAFYEENAERLVGGEFEELKPRIREFLGQQRAAEARDAIVAKADVVVHLEPPRVDVEAVGPSLGPDDAAVTIVEFSDFQCPFCQRATPVIEAIRERYPDDVRIVYRHLPLERIHPRARPAAEASACAGAQDRFWDYHDVLFENNEALSDEDLFRYAAELGLDETKFKQCVEDREFESEVEADLAAARRAGVDGTPAFFVNGILLSGAKPAEEFFELIDAELERSSS